MKLSITHQEIYSRGQLLLRTFFGGFYIALPHGICLIFIGIWMYILLFLSWWAILFTGKYPKNFFNLLVKFQNWATRLNATMYHLVDGYPAFGINKKSDNAWLEVEYPEHSSRGLLLLRTFFGALYVLIPHGFCLYFRMLGTAVLAFLAWWVVLFTGKYPENWHAFNVGSLRWMTRLNIYMMFLTDDYPPFSGKE